MASTYKAQVHVRELTDLLKKQLANLPVCTESFDSNDNPVVTFSADSTPVAGEKVIVIRCKPAGAIGAKDILGNTASQYSHHVIQVCTELNFAGTTDNVADILVAADILPVFAEIGRRGCVVEWHQTANGTVPSVAALDAGTNLKATWQDLYFGVSKAS